MREANGEAEEGDTEFVSVASSKRRKAAESGVEVERSEIFSDDHTESFTHSTPAVVIRNDLASFKALEEKYQNQTKFLVTASTQKEMAPVWIPYRSFGSASAFLGVMANECGVDEWDPSVQLNRDIGSWAATLGMASQFSVKAASITFDWTKFTIRVRLGKDSDLRVVKDGLEKAWMAKDKGEVDQPEEFHIGVMLHV